jgi:hypothetical protein
MAVLLGYILGFSNGDHGKCNTHTHTRAKTTKNSIATTIRSLCNDNTPSTTSFSRCSVLVSRSHSVSFTIPIHPYVGPFSHLVVFITFLSANFFLKDYLPLSLITTQKLRLYEGGLRGLCLNVCLVAAVRGLLRAVLGGRGVGVLRGAQWRQGTKYILY